ncbi:uncharacterized protein [Argopecten irradians]|uniref:uncharacterized protein n=1 Tax=Argopecten irradians TaxID=31199 RepID=UPI0037154BE5
MKRGLRQGGTMSTLYYLIFIDDLLNDLSKSNSGAPLNALHCGNPTLADDITLLALSPRSLQYMLNICQDYSMQWKFSFSTTKSCTMVFGGRFDKDIFQWRLGGVELEMKDNHEHLGIPISNNMSCTKKIEKSYKKGRASLFAILGIGANDCKVNPMIYLNLYRKVVLPSALYGSETWNNIPISTPCS